MPPPQRRGSSNVTVTSTFVRRLNQLAYFGRNVGHSEKVKGFECSN